MNRVFISSTFLQPKSAHKALESKRLLRDIDREYCSPLRYTILQTFCRHRQEFNSTIIYLFRFRNEQINILQLCRLSRFYLKFSSCRDRLSGFFKEVIPETLGILSSDGSQLFSLLICLDATKSVQLSFLFIQQLLWTQDCPEGMCTNGTQVPCEVPSLPNPTTRKGCPHYRGIRLPLFSNSDVGPFTSRKNKSVKVLQDGTYGFSSLSEKTRNSNRLQMSLQRQHFLNLSSQLFKDPVCWSRRGLNPRPPARQTGALQTELTLEETICPEICSKSRLCEDCKKFTSGRCQCVAQKLVAA